MKKFIHSSIFLRPLAMLLISIGSLIPQRLTAAQAPSSSPVNPDEVSEFFERHIPQHRRGLANGS